MSKSSPSLTVGPARPILLVEDDKDIRESIAILLEDEGFAVHQAQHGLQALELLRTIPRPCLVLLDLMMPVMDGHAFLEAMRADEVLITIPVVVVSAGQAPLPLGATGILRKPFDLDALIDVVKEHCQ